jgi:hypothetical protein
LKIEHTGYAVAFADARQRAVGRPQPTWADVAIAYDAGLNHGAELRGTERGRIQRYLRALRIVNATHKAPTP